MGSMDDIMKAPKVFNGAKAACIVKITSIGIIITKLLSLLTLQCRGQIYSTSSGTFYPCIEL